MRKQDQLALLSSIGLLLFQPVMALSVGEDAAKEKTTSLEDMTVTANKIEENVQNVPQSITVISDTAIDEGGLVNIVDITEEVPNFFTTSGHEPRMNFRGLNTSMFTDANPVVLYVDGVPIVARYGYEASFVDAERVEVLRGPQGTLYGKDAIGGIINIISKDPENEWHGKIGTEYGSYNFMRGFFTTNGAVIEDTLYAGLSGQYLGSDGWVENIHNGISDDKASADEHRSFNGFLLYTPTDEMRIRFTMAHDYSSQDYMNGYALVEYASLDDFTRDDAEKVDFDMPTEEEITSFLQNLNVEYDFGGATFTSVTGHRKMNFNGDYDLDYANTPLYDGLINFGHFDEELWSEELRLTSNQKEGIRWIAGIYVDKKKRDQGPYGMQFPSFEMTTSAFLGNFEMNAESERDSKTYAAFGQVIFPFWQRLELTLGGRYQHIDKELDINTYYLPIGMSGESFYSLGADKSWNAFLPKIALSCKLSEEWTSYLSFSQGYMPGGFNNFASSGDADDNSFEPQRSTNYEIGIKGKADNLQMAASLFYMDIGDIHIYKSGGTGIWLTDNADSAHSYGAEMDFTYWLFENLELSGAAGVIKAKYDDYDAGNGVKYDGERVENTPAYSLNLGIAYSHPTGIYSRFAVKNQGSVSFFDSTYQKMRKEDGHTSVDARIGYQFGDWDLYVYGKNLTDEEYITSFIPSSVSSFVYFGEPRTVGLGLQFNF